MVVFEEWHQVSRGARGLACTFRPPSHRGGRGTPRPPDYRDPTRGNQGGGANGESTYFLGEEPFLPPEFQLASVRTRLPLLYRPTTVVARHVIETLRRGLTGTPNDHDPSSLSLSSLVLRTHAHYDLLPARCPVPFGDTVGARAPSASRPK